ncbi:hypothetical protein [Streptomyces sp. SCSIO ZS0520]|uniref:hypothetical protein n=1 Tax=Streptomyces sp. SCSIO ZS0520 TaxID=2892996 RepID=UPI0021DA0512|nr:hypothetical protein [Streptomyces sp. SCSIO ZS0520]
MNRPQSPALKSLPATTNPDPAEPAPDTGGSGAPKAVAEGVLSSVRPDQQTGDGRYIAALLHITAPRDAVPTATSTCVCGFNRSAVGRRKVLALIEAHTAHRDTCPQRNPQERRAAA